MDTSTGVDGSNVYTRAPQVGSSACGAGSGSARGRPLCALSNHFSSGPDTPGRAADASRRRTARRSSPRSRRPTRAPGSSTAATSTCSRARTTRSRPTPTPSDQLAALYDAGLHNLWDNLVAECPSAAYSYAFQGQAQTLDHLFVNAALYGDLMQVRAAHVNADWPADFPGDGPRGLSDHDPQVARYDLPAWVPQLRALLDYYVQQGLVDAKTADQMRGHLDQAAAKLAQGNAAAYRSQLQAFVDQTQDKTPKSVDPVASAQLVAEARLLLAA